MINVVSLRSKHLFFKYVGNNLHRLTLRGSNYSIKPKHINLVYKG